MKFRELYLTSKSSSNFPTKQTTGNYDMYSKSQGGPFPAKALLASHHMEDVGDMSFLFDQLCFIHYLFMRDLVSQTSIKK